MAYPSEMEANFEVEKVFDHEYLVRTQADGEIIESRILVEPDVLEQLGLQGTDEQRIVRETAEFLAGHQPIIDFPHILDLTDLIASYEDFPEQLRQRLNVAGEQ